jgi:hypothetical protein
MADHSCFSKISGMQKEKGIFLVKNVIKGKSLLVQWSFEIMQFAYIYIKCYFCLFCMFTEELQKGVYWILHFCLSVKHIN